VPIRVAARGHDVDAEALFDTGFTGHVVLPPGVIPASAPPDSWLQYGLADGSVVTAPVYRADVSVGPFGPFRAVLTLLGNEAIVGRALMDRFTITLERGTRIIVEQ
jgi:predicted aspartyl protease